MSTSQINPYVTHFAGKTVLSQQHGTCTQCGAHVTSLLVKDSDGGRRWMNADQLITGLVVHTCGRTNSARQAA